MQKIRVLVLGVMVERAAVYLVFFCRRPIVILSLPAGIRLRLWTSLYG